MTTPGPSPVKNFAGSSAAQTLGLGDELQNQLASQQDELRKKKALEGAATNGQPPGLFSPATLALLGNPNAVLGA